jgi:predicted MFS family arabinose efflux permease
MELERSVSSLPQLDTNLRRRTIAIVAGPFLGNLIMLAPPPFFPLISSELGIPIPWLGQIMTGMLLLSAALALLIGPLADRYGHRRVMLVGVGAAASSLVAFGVASSYWALILAGLIGGLATATLPAIGVALATSSFTGVERRRVLGLASSSGAGAAVIGVPGLVVIADLAGWRFALIAAGIIALGAAWLVTTAVPLPEVRLSNRLNLDVFRTAYRPLVGDPQAMRLLLATVLRTVCWSGYLTYLSALLHRELGLSTGQIGGMFLIGGGAYIAASLSARRVLAWIPLRLAVALGNGGMAVLVAVVMSGAAGYWGTLTLIPLTGIAAGIGWVSIVTLLAEESPGKSGTTMAMNGAAFNLGAAGGGALGGAVLAGAGFPVMGIVLALFAVSGSVLVTLIPQPVIQREGSL